MGNHCKKSVLRTVRGGKEDERDLDNPVESRGTRKTEETEEEEEEEEEERRRRRRKRKRKRRRRFDLI
jgi:hypothetical protein